ncbi:MAG: hypothetical protein HYU37_19795 [Acidobacteria bacterium]|nr:hypothetical protein [Acidobacteriota bacterium]
MGRRIPARCGWEILRRHRTNADHAPQRNGRPRDERSQHPPGSLAGRDDVHRGCGPQAPTDVSRRTRLPHQPPGVGCGKRGMDDGQQIVSERVEGVRQ